MKKRLLSLLTAAAITLSLSACKPREMGQSIDPIDEIVSYTSQTIETTEMKTIEPPEDGWTLEQLNQVLYMNGQKIELPLMFSTLGDGYEIRDKRYNDESSADNDIVGGYLYYKEELVALVTFYELENDIEFLKLYFFPDMYESNMDNIEYININGFGLKNNINDIYNFLGYTYKNENNLLIYNIQNSKYSIIIPNTEEFWISLEIL